MTYHHARHTGQNGVTEDASPKETKIEPGAELALPLPAHHHPYEAGAGRPADTRMGGRTHVVDVIEIGYVFEANVYASLTAIANTIAGVHRPGPGSSEYECEPSIQRAGIPISIPVACDGGADPEWIAAR